MPNNAKIILRGNLVRDPETREVNGSNVTSFTVAVSTRVKKEDGTYDTNFHDCSLWGKPGDYFKDRAKKGMLVDVIGEFHQDEYVNKEGERRYRLRCDAYRADVLTRPQPTDGAEAKATPTAKAAAPDKDDDLPF